MTTSDDKRVTLQEFETMAKRGRIHMASEDDTAEPSKADLNKATSPLDFGRLYGYSEASILSVVGVAQALHTQNTSAI
jgi:hypothetical protein